MRFLPKTLTINSIDELSEIQKTIKSEVYKHKLVLIKGLNALEKEEFLEFARNTAGKKSDKDRFIGWDFGYIMELKTQVNPENYLFSTEKVPFHWDGAFHEVPGILVFNCISSSSGGRTLFTNTESILNSLESSKRNLLDELSIKYKTEKKAHYGGVKEQAVIAIHPITAAQTIRLGEEVATKLNPVNRTIPNERQTKLINEIDSELYKERFCYAHEWQAGDLLLADNHTLLHGREEIKDNDFKRHIRRIQIR